MEKFEVIWPHLGDKKYERGDVREAHPATVSHLVKNGTLKPLDEKAKPKAKAKGKTVEKSQPAPKNKAEESDTISNKSMPTAAENKGAKEKTFFDRRKKG